MKKLLFLLLLVASAAFAATPAPIVRTGWTTTNDMAAARAALGLTSTNVSTVNATNHTYVYTTNAPSYSDVTNIVTTAINSSDGVFGTDDGTNITLNITRPLNVPTNIIVGGVLTDLEWSMSTLTNLFTVNTNTVIADGAGTAAVQASAYFWNAAANAYTNPVNVRTFTNWGGWWVNTGVGASLGYSNATLVSRTPYLVGGGVGPGPRVRHPLILRTN